MGLMICKEFIEHMQGKLDVQSVLGKGSRFIIQIPNGEERKKTGRRKSMSTGN
ncbi:MAG: hypothetical protein R6V49_04750 [Bacteroidales bacterium]